MTGAALGTAIGALAWILVQLMPEEQMLAWGWRLLFLSSLLVTVVAMIIRRRLQESPVFAELKEAHVEPKAPVREVFRHGKKGVLLALFMNVGVTAQSYTYQVFMASYLISSVGVDPKFVPKVLLVGAICGGIGAIGMGILSDRFGRRPVYTVIVSSLVLLPAPTFIALNTGSHVAITVAMIVGFILAAQGAVAVQMSWFPELFGNRYRYAGVTLGREFSSVLGGGGGPVDLCRADRRIRRLLGPGRHLHDGHGPDQSDRHPTGPGDPRPRPHHPGRRLGHHRPVDREAGHPLMAHHAGRGRP